MSKILIDETTARRVLEALENSVDLVREDAYETEKLYGNYPTRQARVGGLKVLADDHEKAITALREALAQPQQEPVAFLANGTRFKISYDSRQSGGQIHGIPPELGGRWVAFVAADDDCHLKLTSPPAQQEPVEYWTVANGWVSDQAEVPAAVWVEPDFWEHCNRVNCGTAYRLPAPGRQPLYTSSPSQRKPLTDEEIETVWRSVQANDFHDCVKPFARAIEAAHNIKGDA
jgi:hypothetical protein